MTPRPATSETRDSNSGSEEARLTEASRLRMPYVHLRVKTPKFRLLWLRYVIGFNITQHCAKCLLGYWSRRVPFISNKMLIRADGTADEYEAPFLYLCGVTGRWENNLHVAMRRSDKKETSVDTEDINAFFVGWERVEIPPLPDPTAYPRLFAACRNFQFGYRYFGPGPMQGYLESPDASREQGGERWRQP